MPSAKSKPTQSPQASYAQRYGHLICLAARRGYSERALNALLLSAVAATANRPKRSRKAVSRG